MNKEYAVIFENVSKIYNLKLKQDKKKQVNKKEEFYALREISFKIKKGEVVGILGTNGSGKSTLSSIISGISSVDSGKVIINGEQSLIAINTGLNNQLTGIENIEYKGALLGLSKERINEITEGVKEFTELGKFLEQPVKTYSSGMKARLGFGISIFLDPDIVIIDEALSVGDSSFEGKCIKKIEEFKEKGKTIFFVSHSLAQVKRICNKALWIEGGMLKEYGEINEVSQQYSNYVKELKEKTPEEKKIHNEEVFKRRLVEQEIPKDSYEYIYEGKPSDGKKNKRYIKIVKILLLISLTTVGLLFAVNLMNGKALASKDNKEVEQLSRDYSFIFLTEKSIEEYKDQYRTYIEDFSDEVLDKIIQVNIDRNGDITVKEIPAELQVYYQKYKVKDEIRFLDLFISKSGILNFFNEMQSAQFDDMFILNREALEQLSEKYELTEQSLSINLKNIIGQFIDINPNDYEEIINQLVDDSVNGKINYLNEIINFIANRKIEIKEELMQTKEVKITEVIDSEYCSEISNLQLLDKVFITLENSSINNNVYVSVVRNEIRLIKAAIGIEDTDYIEIEEDEEIIVQEYYYYEDYSSGENVYYPNMDSNGNGYIDYEGGNSDTSISDNINTPEELPVIPEQVPTVPEEIPEVPNEIPEQIPDEVPEEEVPDETPMVPDYENTLTPEETPIYPEE